LLTPTSVLLIFPFLSNSSSTGSRSVYFIPIRRLNTHVVSLPLWLANSHWILFSILCALSISKPSQEFKNRGLGRLHSWPRSHGNPVQSQSYLAKACLSCSSCSLERDVFKILTFLYFFKPSITLSVVASLINRNKAEFPGLIVSPTSLMN
jgi:hypothetical protein